MADPGDFGRYEESLNAERERQERETRARMLQRFPAAREAPPPREIEQAIERIVALLCGASSDLSAVPLDMEHVPAFHRRVYEVARTIPPGMTLSYGDIAARVGSSHASVSSARASSAAFRGGTSRPVSPGITISGIPPTCVPMTGLPRRCAPIPTGSPVFRCSRLPIQRPRQTSSNVP